ncbi:hypothetical protein BASA81_006149 [Batrachochytrium salamandrivorans]|nr:hypothetical protein BASA81_006149 [Batrachochytrium salamandrivorans]
MKLLLLLVLALASRASTCVELIQSGQFQQALQALSANSCPRLAEIENQLTESKSKLAELASKLSRAKSEATLLKPHIEPALQWAQSPDSIYINVKFAHKIDAPACIDVVDAKHELHSNRIVVTAACSKTQAGKHYKLDLMLFSEIAPEQSNWTLTSVGRGSFQLKKLVPQVKWDRLLASREKPKNVHLWWAMQDKFEEAMSLLETGKDKVEANTSVTAVVEEKEMGEEKNTKSLLLLQDAAKRVKAEVEKSFFTRKQALQAELDGIAQNEQRKKALVEDELKRQQQQLLAGPTLNDDDQQQVDYYVKLLQAQLEEESNKQEL